MKKTMIMALLTVGVGMQVPSVLAANKAVLLGIDGVQGYDNEQLTSSGPGWATILTGVWVNKHNVDTNSAGLANADFPSIFKRIHDAHRI